jgi:hypothetical protein
MRKKHATVSAAAMAPPFSTSRRERLFRTAHRRGANGILIRSPEEVHMETSYPLRRPVPVTRKDFSFLGGILRS